jgi:hypothetical protein
MILEGLVSTLNVDGSLHLAPMGPTVDQQAGRFLLKPFATSRSGQNLRRHPEGVLHISDNALLFARAAIGAIITPPAHRPAERIRGWVLPEACRWYEFRILSIDKSAERIVMTADIVSEGRGQEWFGFNRARHAVLEAAILATRLDFLPLDQVAADFARYEVIVAKTGGPAEMEAMGLLIDHLRRAQDRP